MLIIRRLSVPTMGRPLLAGAMHGASRPQDSVTDTMFPGHLFSISASFDSREKRYVLLLFLLFLSITVSLSQGRKTLVKPRLGGPFIMTITNHFDVAGGCDGGNRDCSLIAVRGTSLHSGTDPRVKISGKGPLHVVRRDAHGLEIVVEMPRYVADGPHPFRLENSYGEDEMNWTLKPR